MNFTTDLQEANILNRITIRVIDDEGADRERFDELLRTKHYLKSSNIGGKHLRYVAEVEGEWVAIASFSGPAPQLKARENWIGWSPKQKARRLGMVVNNSRFLMLTDCNKVWTSRAAWLQLMRCIVSKRAQNSSLKNTELIILKAGLEIGKLA